MNTITLLQGRLGNQLFEYAFARAQYFHNGGGKCILSEYPLTSRGITNRLDAFKLSESACFVKEIPYSFMQRSALSLYARLLDSQSRNRKRKLEERFRSFFMRAGVFFCENGYLVPPGFQPGDDIRMPDTMLNIGYFQSEKYFAPYRDQILAELTFKEAIQESVSSLADQIQSSKEPTCLHIRLGDYVKNPLHGVADAAYYRRALKELRRRKPSATIFLFSDNIELVKKELELGDDIHFIPSEVDEQQTMYLGSLCHHFVISNSSFSWWMQYLSRNENRLVLAPSRWYAVPCPCDIYQDNWVLLEV